MNKKHFKFIFFILFSEIMVQKQKEQLFNEEHIFLAFLRELS